MLTVILSIDEICRVIYLIELVLYLLKIKDPAHFLNNMSALIAYRRSLNIRTCLQLHSLVKRTYKRTVLNASYTRTEKVADSYQITACSFL